VTESPTTRQVRPANVRALRSRSSTGRSDRRHQYSASFYPRIFQRASRGYRASRPLPFSRLRTLLADRGRGARPREKPLLIKLQREEKSASPNRVNVIGQNADRDGFEWAALLDGPIDNSQSIHLVHQQPARPVGENDGEEENAAFEFRSDVRGMSNYLAQKWWARREERLCQPYESAELFQHLSHAEAKLCLRSQ
jgi:hypothetical protein